MTLKGGERIEADIVVAAIGAVRNVEWLEGSGLAADEGGVLCDGYCRVLRQNGDIVPDVFAAGDRQIREVMVPRTEVTFLDAGTPVYKAAREALTLPHSRYPVMEGSADDVVGFVHVRDLLDPDMVDRSVRVGDLARATLTLPWTRPILAALGDMRREKIHLALVADEYGGTAS